MEGKSPEKKILKEQDFFFLKEKNPFLKKARVWATKRKKGVNFWNLGPKRKKEVVGNFF
jgi:hypothetical protein